MTTYVIGDVQGCYDQLQSLLTKIQFDSNQDVLWFTGDLVNRGPKSLLTLRFIKSLGIKHKLVLGNHDLHLLAIYYGIRPLHNRDTVSDILSAKDCDELIDWLRHQSLLHYDAHTNFTMIHAGLSPAWTIQQAQSLAHEVEEALRSKQPQLFLQHMYGNMPDQWRDDLEGINRLRCITNFLTRVRLCTEDGRMDFTYKGKLENKPAHLIPWFELKNRASARAKILFGHWAALDGETNLDNVYALDTGCVWGNCLTAMRLEDGVRFMVKC